MAVTAKDDEPAIIDHSGVTVTGSWSLVLHFTVSVLLWDGRSGGAQVQVRSHRRPLRHVELGIDSWSSLERLSILILFASHVCLMVVVKLWTGVLNQD